MVKQVYLIFKTHLDIGYTDYAENVTDKYLNSYLPKAIALGYELKDTSTPFIWTVGSWLVWEALKKDDGTVAKAIEDGIVAWHGLPDTTHTELMNVELFNYGASLSEQLDKRFGKKTTGAKMTDVPGHTVGLVPLLCQKGVDFLHIGVNPATPLPNVPPVFKWRWQNSEITVVYEQGYGEDTVIEDFAVCFAHTNDNMGPQSAEEIVRVYEQLREKYPDAVIKAATLSDVADRLRKVKNLPVVEKEIGDTWIHGAGTDPKKLGRFRELQRHFATVGANSADLTDNLLLIPEHTWGLNVQLNFFYDDCWYPEEFETDVHMEARKRMEKSWTEQRSYVDRAEKVLGICTDYVLHEPDLQGAVKLNQAELDLELTWELFDTEDWERYKQVYMILTPQNSVWATWDYSKVGMPAYKGGVYPAKVQQAYEKDGQKLYKLEFDARLTAKYGLPYFWVICNGENVEVQWFGKKPLRLPHAFWLKFTGLEENWELHKLGQWIKPGEIVGSPLITGVDQGIRNGAVEITTLDAALVAPYGRRLYDFEAAPQKKNLYFNLYNNIWNTNFPLWYSDDTRFRFVLKNR